MKATLSIEEQNQIWQFAPTIEGKDENVIRQDFLGAEIHKSDYDSDSLHGWCVEYVLSPNELREMEISTPSNLLCEANIRILQMGNYVANLGHRKGHYESRITRECGKNRYQQIWQQSKITSEGISALQEVFGLSEEQIKSLFS